MHASIKTGEPVRAAHIYIYIYMRAAGHASGMHSLCSYTCARVKLQAQLKIAAVNF
jgi:hypothetical protein